MQKKIVFLPYDFDTAIGTNNEGALQFSYNLEDIDKVGNNTDVYNGQNSVLWQNLRSAFFDELKSMYQQLRSQGKLSYDKVEQMFEEHQAKWPEAVYNEDAWFTYLQPLVDGGDASYLSMLQGSKAEQRKWWLYNRFRYIDSKYNAGDALTDVITLRGYAKSNVSVTPYADIYATVKFGSYLVQQRATRNQTYTLVCPLDNVNDTEIYIYSASQLASVGDLSGLMVGYANFSYATRLQSLKLGDSGNYENDNLLDLYLGNNVLLETLDVRNCINLGGSRNVGGNTVVSQTPTVDLSGCVGLKNVYFDGTSVKGVTLPNGAPVTILHLPNTITNLDLRNLSSLTDFTCSGFTNVTTLRIENCSSAVDPLAILDDIQTNSRVRIIGFEKTVSAVSEIEEFYDQLDSMRGLDENGNTMDKAQVSGTIHISSMTGAKYTELSQRYPYITLDVASVESTRAYKTWDGSSTVATVTCLNGVPQSAAPTVPARSSTAQYAYAPAGWSLNQDSYTADFDPASTTMGDTTVYAAYSRTVRTYTITWVNNGTTIETDTNVPYGATPQYNGATPTKDGQTSTGWTPTPTTVTGNATYTATYLPSYSVKFYNGSTLLYTDTVIQGGTASYSGSTPVNSEDSSLAFLGWGASSSSTSADAVLTNIQANKSVYAVFESAVQVAEISDSWDTIIANIDNGTYKTKYKVGNYKPLDLGTEGTINMQIVAIDGDELANGGYAPLTFLGIELLKTKRRFNSNSTISWTNSEIRSVLINDIYPLFPSNIKNRVQTVVKTTLNGSSTTITNNETLFIPSARECVNDTSTENSGVSYNQIYTIADNQTRIKSIIGESSPSGWLTRTQRSEYAYFTATGNRTYSRYEYGEKKGVCLGFCLGLETE